MTMKEICGCIHIHTTFSFDGGCDCDTVIRAAEKAGLDYICLTDHMNLNALRAGYEGLRGNVFTLAGYEHNDRDKHNHLLAFGVTEVAGDTDTDPAEYINGVKAQGGICFLAHPAEKRRYIRSLPPYPWTRWDARGFDGIEIWNKISDWMEQLYGWHSFVKIFFPNRYIGDAPPELLARWDEMNRSRFVSAIGSVDAHNRKFGFGPFGITVFPIKIDLRSVRTHYFVDKGEWESGDNAKIKRALTTAMKDGKGFISNYGRGEARGCVFFLRDENGNVEYPGRPVNNLSLPVTLNTRLTRNAEIILLRNGRVIESAQNNGAVWTIAEPGVYRVEARVKSRAWIYTNPFPVGQYPL